MLKIIVSMAATLLATACVGDADFDGSYRLNPQASYDSEHLKELDDMFPKEAKKARRFIGDVASKGGEIMISKRKVIFQTGVACDLVEGDIMVCPDDDRGQIKLRFEDDYLVFHFAKNNNESAELFFERIE